MKFHRLLKCFLASIFIFCGVSNDIVYIHASDDIQENINSIDSFVSFGYKYEVVDKEVEAFTRLNTNTLNENDEIIIVSKLEDKFFALKNASQSGTTHSNEILMDEYGISSSSIDSNIVFKVGLGSEENTYTLYNEAIDKFLAINESNTRDIILSDTSFDFILTYSSVNQSYFGVDNNAMIYRSSISGFKHYAITELGNSSYADELYIYVKSTITIDDYVNVNGRIKFAVDDNISTLFNEDSYTFGIEVTSSDKTKSYIINNNEQSYTIYHEDNKYYVVIEIGDFINNIDRSLAVFTVKAYVTYNDETYYSTNSKSYSIYTMLEKYLADYPDSEFIPSLTKLYQILTN